MYPPSRLGSGQFVTPWVCMHLANLSASVSTFARSAGVEDCPVGRYRLQLFAAVWNLGELGSRLLNTSIAAWAFPPGSG